MKKPLRLVCLLLCLVMLFGVVGCVDNVDKEYKLTIKGVGGKDVDISIAQIKKMKRVDLVDLYAPDKFEGDTTNVVKHTASGVYLDDLIRQYVDPTFDYYNYAYFDVKSTDSYNTAITNQSFSSRPFIAYKYDGNMLSTKAKSGALRLICDKLEMATWAKKVSSIEFSDTPISIGAIDKLTFMSTFKGNSDGRVNIKDYAANNGITIGEDFISSFKALDQVGDSIVEYNGFRTYLYFSKGYIDFDNSANKAPSFGAVGMPIGLIVSNIFYFTLPNEVIINQDKINTYITFKNKTDKNFAFKHILAEVGMLDVAQLNIMYDIDKSATISTKDITYSFDVVTSAVSITSNDITYNNVVSIYKTIK